jgi:hypothetical protein
LNIGIFSGSKRTAILKLEEIVDSLPAAAIKKRMLDKVELVDGTIYRAFSDVCQAEGREFVRMYIDYRTNPKAKSFLASRVKWSGEVEEF